ncbi:hypothetical protein B6V75_02980 [Thioclava sp. F1Mire-8]|nr:hypothetical protein B6V75_02980 [Thioclava sp. F1Mire-8]
MLARKDRLDEIDGLFDADALPKGPISGLEIRPEVFGERVPALRAHLRGIQIAVLRHVESGDWL